MITVAVLLSLIVLPMLWIIFFPVNIRVDTARNLYEITQTGMIRVSLHPGETPLFRMRVLGFLVNTKREEKPKQATTKKGTGRSKMVKPFNAWMRLFKGIVNSFQCRRFVCNIDFDDVVLNAQLFPMAYFASQGSMVVSINFQKQYQLDIWIQARVYRMLWSFIRFYLTK